MKKFKITFFVIVIILIIISGWIFKIVFVSQSGSGQQYDFNIAQGSGVNQISRNLKQAGLIDNSFIFETYLWLMGVEGKIWAGEYQIVDNWSIRQLTNYLTSGNALDNETLITTIEGWNLYNLSAYFEQNEYSNETEFFKLVGKPGKHDNEVMPDWANDFNFLKEKPAGVSLEGYLFPDTYRIFKDSKIEDIISKMLENFSQKVDAKLQAEIKVQGKNLYDVLTLASIVEKEAKTAADKKTVAGVYTNRLKIGMALQADPTVNYITGKKTDRPTYDDLEADSLYNTYKYPGLPPGPICNPGLDSILAAIYPEKNDYYYFINTPEGNMVFGRTFEEHSANRAKYFINN